MKKAEKAFHEFIDAMHTANTKEDFQRIGERTALTLGFKWFAYFLGHAGDPTIITSYPRHWTEHYAAEAYEDVDPLLRQARALAPVFAWDALQPDPTRSGKEGRFIDDALAFGIRAGVTVPIAAGYGRFAAFTFSADDRSPSLDCLVENSKDLLQMIAFSYHAHVKARTADGMIRDGASILLTLRERQCLTWASSGKTMEEIATILQVTPRVVRFHLDNGRRKLGASSLPHAVALALRQELLL